jgi:ferric-dicitrate binding protein FerR (iron transport regulator)
VFDNTSLAEIALMMAERFGVVVAIESGELAQRRISGNFRAQRADELVLALSELLEISSRKENGKIILSASEIY